MILVAVFDPEIQLQFLHFLTKQTPSIIQKMSNMDKVFSLALELIRTDNTEGTIVAFNFLDKVTEKSPTMKVRKTSDRDRTDVSSGLDHQAEGNAINSSLSSSPHWL